MIGQIISHYKILEKIGEGGMGIVYKALDTKLDRIVVLKFLHAPMVTREEDKIRFQHEAKTAAKLHHPNICTIHEIDEAKGILFIVMAYIEGVTLQDRLRSTPLKFSEILNYFIQITEGLSAAHKKGVIHRDIKSTNIMITPEGRAVIMDFGLARSSDMTKITMDGMRMGTIAYMSPEQARGEGVDHRSDLWSLGVMLYESITGTLPFKGDNYLSVMYNVMNAEPKPISELFPDLPNEINTIIKKALSRDLESRYSSADEMLSALLTLKGQISGSDTKTLSDMSTIRIAREPRKKKKHYIIGITLILALAVFGFFIFLLPKEKLKHYKYDESIVVLPFVDMSPAKDQEYFCDGISEEIINALSKFRNVRVIARTTAFSFKGKQMDVKQIGQMLNVNTLLEGSVRKADHQLRITAQLINVSDGSHLWSETYDKTESDIFKIQEDIAQNIVEKLKIAIIDTSKNNDAGSSPLINIGTNNLEAYHHYLKGIYLTFYAKGTFKDNIMKTIDSFRQATQLDPGYAEAYAQLANRLVGAFLLKLVDTDALIEAKEAAMKSFKLNDKLPAAYEALSRTSILGGKWSDAERYARRAVELDPSYASGYLTLALLYEFVFKYKEAGIYWEKAIEVDPLNLRVVNGVFSSRIARYDWNGAMNLIEEIKKSSLESNEQFEYVNYASLLMGKGKMKEAELKLKDGLKRYPQSLEILRLFGVLLYSTGRNEEALKYCDIALKLEPDDSITLNNVGQIYLLKGMNNDALKIFQKTGDHYWENVAISRMGKRDILRKYIAELEEKFSQIMEKKTINMVTYLSAFNIACLYAELGNKDKMYFWLNKSHQIGEPDLPQAIYFDHQLSRYKNEKIFKDLLKKMNIEQE